MASGGRIAKLPACIFLALTSIASLPYLAQLGRGAHYNLRVLIRGDLQTGKTALWRRLQGLSFGGQLPPTQALAVAHLDWTCHSSIEDIVKVEAWDVCDADLSRAGRPGSGPLTLSHGAVMDSGSGAPPSPKTAEAHLWQNVHAAMVLFDPRKPWTWTYVVRLFQEAPSHLPMLLLAGFADLRQPSPAAAGSMIGKSEPGQSQDSAGISFKDVEQAITDERTRSGRKITLIRDYSSADCRGLQAVHAFIQIPYYSLVASSHAQAQRLAEEALSRAQDAVQSLAIGDVKELPSSPGPGLRSYDVTSPQPTAIGTLPTPASSCASAPPRLAPPPPATPPPQKGSSGAGATPIAQPSAPPVALDGIDDSFFDGIDEEPPAPRNDGTASALTATPPAAESAELMGMLPLLEDPEDSFYDD